MEKYRYDQYNCVYEYDAQKKCYIYIGRANLKERKKFIEEYEQQQRDADDEGDENE